MKTIDVGTISVIVPCRNEAGHIRKFLDSILAQQIPSGWQLEVLVSDGESDDGTRDVIREYAPLVRLLSNPGRIVATGLNAAIAASRGAIIIRMDVHTTYAKDYVSECVRVLRETGADNVGGPWVASGVGVIGRAVAAAFRSPFCSGGGKAHNPGYEGEVDTVYLGCWPRAVFESAGLFDPRLVRNQDDEFNLRLRRMGKRVWQSPRIRSSYTPRDSISGLFRQYAQYGYWKVAVIRKHRALASWRHAVPALFTGSLLLAALLIPIIALLGIPGVANGIAAAAGYELTVYGVSLTMASVPFARALELRSLLILPLVFAVYHLGYGLGFLAGIVRPPAKPAAEGLDGPGFFTALTR